MDFTQILCWHFEAKCLYRCPSEVSLKAENEERSHLMLVFFLCVCRTKELL